MKETTIAAISTPMGVGGISIIRLSGGQSLNIANKVFKCNFKRQHPPYVPKKIIIEPRRFYLGKIKTPQFTEQCLMVYFNAPNSYTGEDVVEFQCHGGTVIASGILQQLLVNGATLAQPGEFTKRAFINGKLTLDEAEGVIDMINAQSESEVRAGYNLLEGELSKRVAAIQESITNMLASIEVTLDYPEVDYEEQTSQSLLKQLQNLNQQLTDIISTSSTGLLLKNGTRVLILGKPNVGKSSLLNAMLNYDRAIVTNIMGTTRDSIEETYVYKGVKFVLIDTAGVRDSENIIEKIGIQRATDYINKSDIVLLVLDANQSLDQQDKKIIQLTQHKKTILILNKSDLPQKVNTVEYNFNHIIKVSALNKTGINHLKQTIYDLVINQNVIESNLIITNMRHLTALQAAQSHCYKALASITDGNSLDLVAIDIKAIWLALGEITGETNNEEIINKIFSNFCLGK